MSLESICLRCAANAFETLFQNHDYISDESFAIQACKNCGLVRTDFPYALSELSRYYGESYYGANEEGKRFIGIMEWLVGWFRQSRVRMILQTHGKAESGAILDIGAGRGLMLQSLNQEGWEAHGTELSESLAKRLAKEGIQIHTELDLKNIAFPDEKFDIVMMWHSLEHLAQAVETIAEIARILKSTGKLILEVPNLNSWQAKIGGGRWFHLDAPRHLHHFTPQQLEDILASHGLQVRKLHSLSLEQGIYGFLQTLLNRLTTENNVLYCLLKRQRPHATGLKAAWNLTITLIAFVPFLLLATLLELVASALGHGAVISMIVEKQNA